MFKLSVEKKNTPLRKANLLFQKKNLEGAIKIYREAIKTGGYVDLHVSNLVLALKKIGQHESANTELYLGLVNNPKSSLLRDLLLYENRKRIFKHSGPKLSIIVPVYNSEKYLEKCLQSILKQTYNDFELIIVNDGSKDESGQIIKRLAKNDSRIKVITNSKASGNPGTPRNQAIEIARGAYIGFVDSDDWIDSDFYERLMRKALTESSDIVFSGGFKNHIDELSVESRVYNNDGFDNPDSERYKYHDSFMIWDKIYNSKLLDVFSIRLGETKAAVDVPFIVKVYYYAQNISYDNKLFGYHYRRESESSVTVTHRKKSNCNFEFEAYSEIIKWTEEQSVKSFYRDSIDAKMISSFLYTLKIMSKVHFRTFFQKVKARFAEINEDHFKQFCIEQKKWWLYKEFLTVRDQSEEEAFHFFELKNNEIEKKRLDKLFERKLFLPGEKKGILFFPAWLTNNPYQKLFYEALSDRFDIKISGFAKEALCKKLLKKERSQYRYIHLHWLHAFIDNERSDGADYLLDILKYSKSLGYKIIYTAHNIISHDSKNYENEFRLRLSVLRYVDIAIAHGNMAKKKLIDEFKIPEKNIFVVPHGTYDGYYKNFVSRNDARKKFGLKNDHFVFLFFGNIKGYKGIKPLLTQFEKVAIRYSNARLIIAGRVIDEEGLDLLEKGLKIGNIIFKPGFVSDDDVQYYFNASDVCVLPYKKIMTSGAAMLSLTFSCPVIAPNAGVLPEVIGNEVGILFSNYDEMGESMEDMLLYQRRGVTFKTDFQSYKHKFSWYNLISNMNF